jgi:hypothetical protein
MSGLCKFTVIFLLNHCIALPVSSLCCQVAHQTCFIHVLLKYEGILWRIGISNGLFKFDVQTYRRTCIWYSRMRYTARGAMSLERFAEDANGDLVYTFTKPWSDGTTGIKLAVRHIGDMEEWHGDRRIRDTAPPEIQNGQNLLAG